MAARTRACLGKIPQTGARGTVTPIATAYNQDGFVCRDFLASYVKNSTESWMRGEACRQHKGRWEVRSSQALAAHLTRSPRSDLARPALPSRSTFRHFRRVRVAVRDGDSPHFTVVIGAAAQHPGARSD